MPLDLTDLDSSAQVTHPLLDLVPVLHGLLLLGVGLLGQCCQAGEHAVAALAPVVQRADDVFHLALKEKGDSAARCSG